MCSVFFTLNKTVALLFSGHKKPLWPQKGDAGSLVVSQKNRNKGPQRRDAFYFIALLQTFFHMMTHAWQT
jgi:hypothetical protein